VRLEEADLDIPLRYADSQDAFKSREWFLPLVRKYLLEVEHHRQNGEGVLLSGSNGTGKTWTACALARTVDRKAKRRVLIVFQHASELLDRVYRFGTPLFVGGWDRTYDEVVETCSCLILDDLGYGCGTGVSLERLNRLLRKRVSNCRLTFVTTNLRLHCENEREDPEIVQSLTPTIVSVLEELCPIRLDVGRRLDSRSELIVEVFPEEAP